MLAFLVKIWPKNAKNYLSRWRPWAFKTSTFGITWCDNFWPNLRLKVAEGFHIRWRMLAWAILIEFIFGPLGDFGALRSQESQERGQLQHQHPCHDHLLRSRVPDSQLPRSPPVTTCQQSLTCQGEPDRVASVGSSSTRRLFGSAILRTCSSKITSFVPKNLLTKCKFSSLKFVKEFRRFLG